MKNKDVKEELIYLYGPTCWLKGTVSADNPLTLHHIIPKRFGGKTEVDNGALLTLERHKIFNFTEMQLPVLAEEINYYLYTYHGKYPDIVDRRINEYLEMIYEFKEEYLTRKLIKRR